MAEDNLEQLVPDLLNASWSSNSIIRITDIFEKQNSQTISAFISVSLKSILAIEQWTWQMLSKDSNSWINIDSCAQVFHILHSFNMKLISHNDEIQADTKISLLIPSNITWIDGLLEQIESSSDTFLTLAGLWIETLSHLAHQLPDIVFTPTMQHLN
ncbi:unnamed protein product, partial [Rotaria socialis]